MEKRYYNADSLERSLLAMERQFGMSSSEFYEQARVGGTVTGVPSFVRSVWASLYRDFCRLSGGDDFALSVKRTLELA